MSNDWRTDYRHGVEVLRAARELLEDEKNWIKGALTADIGGRTCYCSIGAINEASHFNVQDPDYFVPGRSVALDLLRKTVFAPIATWNDDPTTDHHDIIAGFTAAIKAGEEKYA